MWQRCARVGFDGSVWQEEHVTVGDGWCLYIPTLFPDVIGFFSFCLFSLLWV